MPLKELRQRAEAMTRGDFSLLGTPVGGSPFVEDLRRALDVLGAHVAQSQRGMHAYVGALTAAQEAERSRIARELHDDTIQRLIAIGQMVERVQRLLERDPAAVPERLAAIRGEIVAAVQDLRAVIANLRPPALDDLGLLPAVELLLSRTDTGAPAVELSVTGAPRRLDPQSELMLFRIIQEAYSNILRHAQAQHARVTFSYGPAALTVTVADDGRGFVPPHTATIAQGTWGLFGMQERAALVGGMVTVRSAPGTGTTVEVRLPYLGREGRDPVCGMEVGPDALTADYDGRRYRFCSPACRELFLADPDTYAQREPA